jgi:hypothetical protein
MIKLMTKEQIERQRDEAQRKWTLFLNQAYAAIPGSGTQERWLARAAKCERLVVVANHNLVRLANNRKPE